MKRLWKCLAVLAVCSTLYAQFGMNPNGTDKGAIKLIQVDKTEVSVEARVADWKLANNMASFRNKAQMSFKTIDSPVVSNIGAIVVPFTPSDLPGGTLYVVRLDSDKKSGYKWDTNPEGQNVPVKRFVVVDTSGLKTSKVDSGTMFDLDGQTLPSGIYAITIANNKYAWPFVVR
jgi:hypothetical protein